MAEHIDKPGSEIRTVDTSDAEDVSVSVTADLQQNSGINAETVSQSPEQMPDGSDQLERIDKHTSVLPQILAILSANDKPASVVFPDAAAFGLPNQARAETPAKAQTSPGKKPTMYRDEYGRFVSKKDQQAKVRKQKVDADVRNVDSPDTPLVKPEETSQGTETTTNSVTTSTSEVSKSESVSASTQTDLKTADPKVSQDEKPESSSNTDEKKRDASGRFLSKSEQAAQDQKDKEKEQRERGLFEKIGGVVSAVSGTLKPNDGDLSDAAGTAAGGAFWQAAVEVTTAAGEAKDKLDNFNEWRNAQKEEGSEEAESTSADTEVDQQSNTPDLTIETPEKAEPQPSTPAKEAQDPGTKEKASDQAASQKTVKTVTATVESQSSTAEVMQESAESDEKRHKELVETIEENGGGGGGSDGGGILSSVSEMFGGKEKAGGKTGGRFGKLAKFGKIGGAIAAPLAAITAGFTKYSEVKDRDDLSSSQKTAQVGSTAVGAGGGALAGAAAGAAFGSVIPGIGTVAGGLVGGVLGALGGSSVGEWAGEKISDYLGESPEADKAIQKSMESASLNPENAPGSPVQVNTEEVSQSFTSKAASPVTRAADVQPAYTVAAPKIESPENVSKHQAEQIKAAVVSGMSARQSNPGQLANNPSNSKAGINEKSLAKEIGREVAKNTSTPAPAVQTDFSSSLTRLFTEDRI